MPETNIKDSDELDGLSGKPSAQSKLLSEILTLKGKDQKNLKAQSGGKETQDASGELTPFTRAVDALNNLGEKNTASLFNSSLKL